MSDSSDSVKTTASRHDDKVTARRAHRVRVSTVRDNYDDRKVKIKVPPFTAEDPELWFALLEGQFESNGVIDDYVKFTQVTNNLDLQFAKAVKDIIVKPPASDRYSKIKTELIKRLCASHEKKVKQLLTHEELGDRKPSQFLRHLQDLAGPSVPEDFVRSIWSSRLPHNIQTVLASQPTHSLEQLADLADRIQDLTSSFTVAAASTSGTQDTCPRDEISELKKMVQQLTLKLEEHIRRPCCSNGRSGHREHNRSSPRGRSRSNSSVRKYPVCYYHTRFGEQAEKCIKPCNYKKAENPRGTR